MVWSCICVGVNLMFWLAVANFDAGRVFLLLFLVVGIIFEAASNLVASSLSEWYNFVYQGKISRNWLTLVLVNCTTLEGVCDIYPSVLGSIYLNPFLIRFIRCLSHTASRATRSTGIVLWFIVHFVFLFAVIVKWLWAIVSSWDIFLIKKKYLFTYLDSPLVVSFLSGVLSSLVDFLFLLIR